MKKVYEKPVIETTKLDTQEIMTVSSGYIRGTKLQPLSESTQFNLITL